MNKDAILKVIILEKKRIKIYQIKIQIFYV
jgi:hypothetical protein